MKNINDIAKLAGVSKSTVSRYLNGGSVSEKTKQKIDEIVKETGYHPNHFAQSLKAKHSKLIGVIVPRLNSFASNETLLGIETKMREHHYQTLIANTDLNKAREKEALQMFDTSKVDGIIIMATDLDDELVKKVQKLSVPVIIVGQYHESLNCIIQDDFSAGRVVGNYVNQRHFTNIAFIGVPETDEAVGISRKNGVLTGLNAPVTTYETTFNLFDAYNDAKRIITNQQHDLLICATDNIALGVLKAAHELNVKVPTSLSIIGFGGYETTNIVTPMITTIRFDYFNTGIVAAESMLKQINEENIQSLQKMSFHLDEKESVDIK